MVWPVENSAHTISHIPLEPRSRTRTALNPRAASIVSVPQTALIVLLLLDRDFLASGPSLYLYFDPVRLDEPDFDIFLPQPSLDANLQDVRSIRSPVANPEGPVWSE
jgi:hypothetical protein